jgi:hypothetical protein
MVFVELGDDGQVPMKRSILNYRIFRSGKTLPKWAGGLVENEAGPWSEIAVALVPSVSQYRNP